ncbi:MAG: carboxypeptidase regulatory-like domain-containing protein [Chloroflexi bacterium]|nr:carboxypeptidase regulatory-like domain-containing protein [Chloroflexota bacterium]
MIEQNPTAEGVLHGARQVAPIFQLLGEGRLAADAVEALTAVLKADGLPLVSQQQLIRACQIAQQPRPAAAVEQTDSPLRRLVATLVYNLGPRTARVGVRGATALGHTLLFAADEYEVMIQGAPDSRPSRHLLTGQVSWDGEPVPQATVLLENGSHRAEMDADGDGSFRFPGLEGGSYQLDVWTGNDLIVCAPVVLGR